MNREIKFRVWDRHNIVYLDHFILPSGGIGWETTGSYHKMGMCDPIIMQYTGLKDKNGKEIYEGDICNINYPYISPFIVELGVNGKSKYHSLSDNFYQLINFAGTDLNTLEVIGNIYENPELLNNEPDNEKS